MPVKTFRRLFILFAVMFLGSQAVPAQTTSFTYQGKLTDSGNLANGNYDLQFKLFNAVSGGAQQGTTQTATNVTVTNGIFTVQLDFGVCASCFDGSARYLEIAVKPTSGGSFTTLTPRQPITSTPYALKTANLTFNGAGNDGAGIVFTNSNTFTGEGAGLNTTPDPVLDSINGKFNAFYGAGAGKANTTGNRNAFFGGGAGFQNTTGNFNAFFGYRAGLSNTTGNFNAFFGEGAGESNTTGGSNAFFGWIAGLNTTTGGSNAFFGVSAGESNTTGGSNAFFGASAGSSNTTGSQNTFVGVSAGGNSNGNNNTFVGSSAGLNNTGSNNLLLGSNSNNIPNLTNAAAIGANALVTQSHSLVLGAISGLNGCSLPDCSSVNVGIGTTAPEAKFHVSGGSMLLDNNQGLFLKSTTNVQKRALFADSSNILRIGSGGSSGFDQVSFDLATPGTVMSMLSTGNVGIGTSAPGEKLDVSGSGIIRARVNSDSNAGIRLALGNQAKWSVATVTGGNFQIFNDAAGSNALWINSTNNFVGVGTTSPDQLLTVNGNASKPGGGSWATFSDERLKDIHGNYTRGLNAVMQLRPIRFEYKADNALGLRGTGEYIGFSAQEVERILPEAVSRNASGYLLVNNDPILWAMLNATKELKQENDALKQKLNEQQKQVEALRRLVCKSNPDEEVCKP